MAAAPNALAQVARLARMPVLMEPQGATRVASFARDQLRLAPGQRCVLVSTASGAKRAGIVSHFLRRGGYLPLHCELQGGAPTEAAVRQVMEAATRTGSTFVAVYGGAAALSVGKAAAALLTNPGGGLADYATELGGSRSLAVPSLPLLAVPSCPSSSELTREAHVLLRGQALARLVAHPASVQGTVIDPALAVTLPPAATLTSGFATLVHCAEGLLRPDSGRELRALAFEGLQRAAYALPAALARPTDVRPRAQLALASAIASVLISGGPLGVCRGLGLAVAGRYDVPYAAAVTAMAPEALAVALELALQRFDELEPGGPADDEGAGGQGDVGGRHVGVRSDAFELQDEGHTMHPRSKAMQRRVARAVREDADAESDIGGDAEMTRLLNAWAGAAQEAASPGGNHGGWPMAPPFAGAKPAGAGGGAEGDSDASAALVRFTRLGATLRRAVARASTGGRAQTPPAPLEALGADWRDLGKAGSDADGDGGGQELDLEALRESLVELRGAGAAHGAPAPALDDFRLTPLDLQAIAEAAEVEADTMAAPTPLRKSDLVAILRAS